MLVPYAKPPLSFADQISRLAQKGMLFKDKTRAESKLASIRYYRLSGYWYPFRVRDKHKNVFNAFEADTDFNQVIFLYEWDRQLRSVILDAIERVEIAVRRPDKTKDPKWLDPITPRNDRIFYILLMLRHLLKATDNGNDWISNTHQLLEQLAHSDRWRSAMGLPEKWREHPLWQ